MKDEFTQPCCAARVGCYFIYYLVEYATIFEKRGESSEIVYIYIYVYRFLEMFENWTPRCELVKWTTQPWQIHQRHTDSQPASQPDEKEEENKLYCGRIVVMVVDIASPPMCSMRTTTTKTILGLLERSNDTSIQVIEKERERKWEREFV